MADRSNDPLRVAIAATTVRRRLQLEMLLKHQGWQIVVNTPVGSELLAKLSEAMPDVLLIDLDGAKAGIRDTLEMLLDECEVPVLINDHAGAVTRKTSRQQDLPVLHQLAEALGKKVAKNNPPADISVAQPVNPVDKIPHVTDQITGHGSAPGPGSVWVLSASLGGPQALSDFLAHVTRDLDIAFLVVQRMANSCMPLLAGQLVRNTALNVVVAQNHQPLQAGEVVLVSRDQCIDIDGDGLLSLSTVQTTYGFSVIDHTMELVARVYKHRSGAIIFSGMGNEGVQGSHAILNAGGTVWTQSANSCVVKTMPEYVRNHCKIGYSAEPEQLAKHLCEQLAGAAVG